MTGDDLEQLEAHLVLFLQESADYHRDSSDAALRDVLHQAAGHIARIYRRIQRSSGRYVVAVVGLSNVGKSTLINSLFGVDLAPRRNGPCTACPVEFTSGESFRVTARYADDFRPREQQADGPEAVQKLLTELVDASHLVEGQSCQRVLVELDHPLLANGLVLADTPGFGAAQVETDTNSHEKSVRQYLSQNVSLVFWVVLAEQGIGQRERAFYDELLTELCDDVIVTGGEDWDPRSRERFAKRYRPVFARNVPQFHFVGTTGETAIASLADRIRALQSPADRLKVSSQALLELAQQLGRWLKEHFAKTANRNPVVWRPDSWARLAADRSAISLRDQILSLWRID